MEVQRPERRTSMPWSDRIISSTKLENAEFTLGEPARCTYPREISGSRDYFVLGFWLSEKRRARGAYRLGEKGDFHEMCRLTYSPARLPWYGRIEPDCELGQSLHCRFEEKLFKDVTGLEASENPAWLNGSITAPTPLMMQTLWYLVDELKHPGFAHHISIDALSKTLLVEVARAFRQDRPAPALLSGAKLARWQVERIRMFIESTPFNQITTDEVAALCGVSEAHFRRIFKTTTGEAFGAYVEKIRIDKAKRLLADGALPLKQIAHSLGFSHASAFSTSFRNATGATPRAFRQMSKS